MSSSLLELLEYRVVLGAVAATRDGLVVARAGLTPDDAEMLAASASKPEDDARCLPSTGGVIEVRHGVEMRLIVLTERNAPAELIDDLMAAQLAALEEALVA